MPRAKQEEMPIEGPGVSLPRFKDIDRLADQFHDKLEERATISEEITKIEGRLIDKMKEHELTHYRYRDQEVIYKPGKVHVKVKAVKAQAAATEITDDSEPPGE